MARLHRTALAVIATVSAAPVLAETVTIRGVVAVSPVAGATVSAYQIAEVADQAVATTTSDATGAWSLELPAELAQSLVLLRASGGHYSDPVTQEGQSLGTLYSVWLPGQEAAAITPISSILTRRWQLIGNAERAHFESMHRDFVEAIGFDPLTQTPEDSADNAAWAHAASIGGISAVLGGSSAIRNSEAAMAGPAALLDALIDDLTDGVLDGVAADDKPTTPGDSLHPLPVLESLNRPLLSRAIERYVAAHREAPLARMPNFDSWRPSAPEPMDSGPYSEAARWRVEVSGEFEASGNRQSVGGEFARLKGADMPRPGEPMDCKRLRWLLGPNFSDMRSIYHSVSCEVVGRYQKPPRKPGQGFQAVLKGQQLVSHGNALAETEFEFRAQFSWLSE